ncbi:hypothetical protein SNEBB_005674 [Seison nebaliae]|nr:hypothetical protein SNEBB_005674 [Seison nebaliae]
MNIWLICSIVLYQLYFFSGVQSKISGRPLTLSFKFCNEDSPKDSPVCGEPSKDFKNHVKLKNADREEFRDYVNDLRRSVNSSNMNAVTYSLVFEAIGQRAAWRENSEIGVTAVFEMDETKKYIYCFETDKKTLSEAYIEKAREDKKYFKNVAILKRPKKNSAEWKDYTHQSYLFIMQHKVGVIGCGMTQMDTTKGRKVCCATSGRELEEGKAYEEGEPCTACVKECKKCVDDLCKCPKLVEQNTDKALPMKPSIIINIILTFSTFFWIFHA